MVYLIKSHQFYKIGYAGKFDSRKKAYITDNPNVVFLEGIQTYKKTKHQLETAIQKEVEEMGYKFHNNHGVQTEWFKVPRGKEIHLKDFKCCQNRKVYELGN